jgi:hypothetical protein
VKNTRRLETAIAIRDRALELIETQGRWEKPQNTGPEMKVYEDSRFNVGFYVRPPEPIRSGLYTLDIWDKHSGKVLSLAWDSIGAEPKIISFKRGEWESLFLDTAN